MKQRFRVLAVFVLSFIICLGVLFSSTEAQAASQKEITIGAGEQIRLKVKAGRTYSEYKWTVDNPRVASITQRGKITGLRKGKTFVKVYRRSEYLKNPATAKPKFTYMLTVKKAPSKLSVKGMKSYIFVKDSFELTPSIGKKEYCGAYKYKSSNPRVATVSSSGKVVGVGKGKTTISVSTYNKKKVSFELEVKGIDKLVAFTFDDGPSQYTDRLVEAIHANGYHATFFMVGIMMPGHQATMNKMVKYGDELGSHSWQHDNLQKKTINEVVADMNATKKRIKDYTGVDVTVVRSPYGSQNEKTLQAYKKCGLAAALWNIDCGDWQTTSSVTVENNIMKYVHPGAILLLHDSHSWSVDAIVRAMPRLKAQGYELVTMSEFARLKGIKFGPGDCTRGTPN